MTAKITYVMHYQGGYQWVKAMGNNCFSLVGRHVVSAESIGSFKRQLDQSMDRDDRWDG